MSENNDASNESNSLSSDGIIQSTRLVSSNPLIRTGVLRPSVLGHSVLGAAAAAAGTTATDNSLSSKPDAADTNNSIFANNPFLKESNDDEEDSVSGAEGGDSLDKSAESASSSNNKPAAAGSVAKAKTMTAPADDEEVDDRPDPLTLLRRNGIERSNIFAAAKNSIPLVEKSGFVFGQNVHERVVGENINTEKSTNADANATGGGASASSSSTSEMLFSDVIQNARAAEIAAETAAAAEGGGAGADGTAASNDLSKETETKSLSQVAKEYEESRAQKRKYEEVETFTGEENEVNIIDINCKLFAFVNSNWEERGRGSLRLNDSKIEGECSRVVFRTAGNLRLLLNTKVWAGMVAERPSLKSLRLTAMDQTGVIKIFLVMARPAEIKELHMSLVYRIDKRKLNHPEEFRRADSQNNGDGAAAEEAADGLNNGAVGDTESLDKASAIAAESEPDDNGEPSPKKAVSTSAADEASN